LEEPATSIFTAFFHPDDGGSRFFSNVSTYLSTTRHNISEDYTLNVFISYKKKKGKAIPVTDRGGPQGCERSRLPHFLGNWLTDGG
jgi:hypothetical protein